VTLECAPDLPRVRADAARIKQVVLNLVQNALAATEERGAIRMRAGAEAGRMALIVEDTGVGITPADLPRIFDESFSTRAGGDGLGLPIARRIVEQHGGELTVESRPGEGTTFRVILPAE
jgi:signal transduction histidine kinase